MAKKESFYEKHQDKLNFVIAITLMLLMVFVFSLVKIYFEASPTGEPVAMVNGEPIYRSQLDARIEQSGYQDAPEELILQQMIQEELLLQAIEGSNIQVTEEELTQQRAAFMKQRGLTDENLDQVLDIQGLRRADFDEMLKNTLKLEKLLEREAYSEIEVTRQEVREYYENNLDSFTLPERHEVQQVTYTNATESSESAARETFKAKPEDLCAYASENHEVETCGTFNITQFSGLPDKVLNAITGLDKGEYGIVESEFGHHVIRKIAVYPEGAEPLSSVREEIEASLRKQRESRAFSEYAQKLRQEATIENYLLDEIAMNITKQNPTYNEMISCIVDNATLYGARWDSQTKRQLGLFGNATVDYVECTSNGFAQTAKCQDEGIEGYPTWEIGGEKVMGFQDIETLAGLTGCR